jgi:hypothetical protein
VRTGLLKRLGIEDSSSDSSSIEGLGDEKPIPFGCCGMPQP